MNILLWILQVLLALHTIMGALWKFSNTAEAVTSLKMIPQGAWMALSAFELLCALFLILPGFYKPVAKFLPLAALGIAAEMILFCGLHIASGEADKSPMIYWGIVAVFAAFITYGRKVLKPL